MNNYFGIRMFPIQATTISKNSFNEIQSSKHGISTKFFQPLKPIHSSKAFHYFRVYFNVVYIFGFSPFKFEYDAGTHSYSIKKASVLRKVKNKYENLIQD